MKARCSRTYTSIPKKNRKFHSCSLIASFLRVWLLNTKLQPPFKLALDPDHSSIVTDKTSNICPTTILPIALFFPLHKASMQVWVSSARSCPWTSARQGASLHPTLCEEQCKLVLNQDPTHSAYLFYWRLFFPIVNKYYIR